MAPNQIELYDLMAGLQMEFGGQIIPSEENEYKAFLDFYLENESPKKASNESEQRAIGLTVLEHNDGFDIVVDDHTLEMVSDDLEVKTVEEAINLIRLELEN